ESQVRSGTLLLRRTRVDTLLPGRTHERYAQIHRGVPVLGGDLVRQVDGIDTVSVFGTLYEGIDVDPRPAFDADHAVAIAAAASGRPLGPRRPPELVVLPREDGSFALAYRLAVFTEGDRVAYTIDAHSGAVEARHELPSQSAVGHGRGV